MSGLYLGSSPIYTTYVGSSFSGNMQLYDSPYKWRNVIKACADGTYSSIYKLGDTVPLDLGSEGVINMEIVAMDTDELTDGTGYAPITWIGKELLATKHRMNPKLTPANIEYTEGASWELYTSSSDSQYYRTTVCYGIGTIATATWTLTATSAGTLTISYWVSTSNTELNTLTLTVNDTVIVTDWAKTTHVDYLLDVAEGDVVVVSASYYLNDDVNERRGYVQFESTGTYTETATIENAPIGSVIDYVEGTGTIEGWGSCEMRTYIQESIEPLIPTYIRNSIKPVNKVHFATYADRNYVYYQYTSDVCWIPSYREIFGGTERESIGVTYCEHFSDATSLKKSFVGAPALPTWYLRTARNHNEFHNVFLGSASSRDAHSSSGVCLGFCT